MLLASGFSKRLFQTITVRIVFALVAVAFAMFGLGLSESSAQTPAEWEVWRVFVPAEDVGKLVPLDYNLIEIDDLEVALKREAERRSQAKKIDAHISESIYVVRANADSLTSDQCRWTVRSQLDNAKLTLRDLSVALRNSGVTPTEDKPLLPNVRYATDGSTTLTNIAGDANYWFGFSASPTSVEGKQLVYDLSVPPATMAKMLISAPENMSINSPDVIVSPIDDPRAVLPENWPILAAYENHRWHLVHLSGKSQFRLNTAVTERKDALSYQQFVRRAVLAYVASSKAVTLSADFEVERIATDEPLRLSIDPNLKIRSLTANDKSVDYRIVQSADSAQHIIEIPGANSNGQASVALTSNGRVRVRVEALTESKVPFDQALPSIEIARSFAWEGRTTITAEDDLQVEEVAFVGRPELAKPKLESTTIGRRWGADWLGAVPTITAKIDRPTNRWKASLLTRLTIQQDWIAATTNLKLNCRGLQSNEMRLRIGQGWFIDDVTIDPSEHSVNIQLPDGEAKDAILSWDRLNSEMSISLQIVAHLPRDTDVEQFNLAAPRIVTVVDGDQTDLYAVEQTGRLRIQPDPLLLRLQVRGDDIEPWQTQLVGLQLYRGLGDQFPPLVLQRATGTYSAKVKSIARPMNGQMQVTHAVEVEPTAGPIEFASCLLSVPPGAAVPIWQVTQEVNGEQVELTKAVVTASRNEADARGETRFDFQLAEATADPVTLQCEVLLPIESTGNTNLPLVNTSVATDTWLIVPRQYSLPQSIAGLVALPGSICCEAGALTESLGEDANSMAAYRYDPTLVSSVELRPASRVDNSGAWVWTASTEHWLYNDGRVMHRNEWQVFAPENMTFVIHLPSGWVVNRITVNGASVTVNQPLDSSKLPIAIPKGERVSLAVQSLSLVSEPHWFAAIELPRPSCSLPILEERDSLWLQPGRLTFDELLQDSSLSVRERLLPSSWWRWLSPAVRAEDDLENDASGSGSIVFDDEASYELGWRRVALQPVTIEKSLEKSLEELPKVSSAISFDATSSSPTSASPSSADSRFSAAGQSHAAALSSPVIKASVNAGVNTGEASTATTMVAARVKTIDRSSLSAFCVAISLAGAGWSFTVLGDRPRLWWIALTAATAATLVVPPTFVIFAQLTLLCLVCGGLTRMVRVLTATLYSRGGQASRRGSTVVRSGAIVSTWLILFAGSTPLAEAQALNAKSDKSPTVYGVLIPLNDEGELSAKHVYVPNKLMNLLDHSESVDPEEQTPQILNAKYILRLRSDTSLTTSYVQEFTVEFDLLFNSTDFALRLPFLKSQLQLLRGSVAGQEIYVGQRLLQNADEIVFRPAEAGRVRLRLQLIPTATENAGRSSIDVAIPRIASSTLEVLAGNAMDVEVKAQGAVRRLTTASWIAELGPSDRLRVNWPTRTQRFQTNNQTQTQSDTWLHIHEGQVVADCQLRVSGAGVLPKQLHVIVDAAWEPVGSQWQDVQLVSSELSAVGSRRIYTVNRAAVDDRMVIRALVVPRNGDSAASLSVPFFALQENLSASRSLALSGVGRSRWRLVGNEFWNRLTSSASEMGWESSKPTMTDAWRVPTGSLNGTLQRIAAQAGPIVDEYCELQLLSTATQLNYRADWSQAADEQVAKFELPKQGVVQSVSVNGGVAEYQLSNADDRRYLLVRMARNAAEIRSIQIQLAMDALKSKTALPRVLLQDVAVTSSQYQVNCGSELKCALSNVAGSDPEGALTFSEPVQDSTVMLSTLTAPVGVAELGNRFRDAAYLPAEIEIKKRKPVKLTANVMALSRSEQGWRATVEAMLESDEGVNFVFFDVPSSIRDLIESTGSPFRISAAGAAGRSTLCLLPRSIEGGKARVSFTFRLAALGSSQSLAVPEIAYMGQRSMRPTLALPKKIDEQTVQWSRAGRRLGANWLAKSGVSFASDDYVCFEMGEVQQPTSWRPAQLDSKPPEMLFQWGTLEQDSRGNSTGVFDFWIDPNNHLDVTAAIPTDAELIGVQSGNEGAVWHRDAFDKIRILMQPSYLPVHIRMLLKWKAAEPASTHAGEYALRLPVIEAAGTRKIAIAVNPASTLRGFKSETESESEVKSETNSEFQSEQAVAPERTFATEIDSVQFDALLAEQWSRLLLKALPVVSDMGGEELASWIRSWSPSVTELLPDQAIPANADLNSADLAIERDTVGEFWDWYVEQLSDFDLESITASPPSVGASGTIGKLGLLSDRGVEAASKEGTTWFIAELPATPNAELRLVFAEPQRDNRWLEWLLPLAGFLAVSGCLWFAMMKLNVRAVELLAQQPWLYWLLLAALCWLLLPSVLPSVVIAMCALGMTITQLFSSRRRQLALRR